jgi:ubiquinone/menaquinone biosynthesis C-methylase UbiE
MLLNPLRNFLENPGKLLGPYVREGMTVIEPGCGMGFFTLPLAKMVGPSGKVIVIDVQEIMIEKVQKRARRAGLEDRIESRLVKGSSLNLNGTAGKGDLALALYVVHEVPNQFLFFSELSEAIKPGCKLLVYEPAGHISEEEFQKSLSIAVSAGLLLDSTEHVGRSRRALFIKQ